MIKLIVGLGNPGQNYEKTRHNAGFWLLNQLSKDNTWREEKKFFGHYQKITLQNHPLHLLKPTTFMNHSGRSVASCANFFQIKPEEIMIVHDELDLPEGVARFKQGGGHGGHNGLRDIISALGNGDFLRLRLGIDRPKNKNEVIHYVLHAPSKEGREKIDCAITRAILATEHMLKENLEKAMHFLHSQEQ